jgi:hypothetical protein
MIHNTLIMQNKTNSAWKIYVAKKSFIVCSLHFSPIISRRDVLSYGQLRRRGKRKEPRVLTAVPRLAP